MIVSLGLPRTGTSSLTKALERLDYKCSTNSMNAARLTCWCSGDVVLDHGRDVQGEPAFAFWHRIVAENPDAKFIVTTRDFESWYRSCATLAAPHRVGPPMYERYEYERRIKASGQRFTLALMWWLGLVAGGWSHDRADHQAIWKEHYAELLAIDMATEVDMLVLNVCRGEGWNELGGFLGREQVPDESFPWMNSRGSR